MQEACFQHDVLQVACQTAAVSPEASQHSVAFVMRTGRCRLALGLDPRVIDVQLAEFAGLRLRATSAASAC
jgi:hypothetical protein